MSKAILVIDMPKSCTQCPFLSDHYTDMCCGASQNRTINYPYPKDFRQEWCPLKDIPLEHCSSGNPYDEYGDGYADGYNDCREEILGDKYEE